MWYNYLNREQHYLRSYRTHNLWFDYYHKKVRVPRNVPFHLGVFKRLAKTYSGVSPTSHTHHSYTRAKPTASPALFPLNTSSTAPSSGCC